jgi:3-phenylpropionate/cinnamic acid dioxygenase small subunit
MSSDDAVARTVLRAEIEELLVETAYLLDRGRFEELVLHYTDDCEIVRPLPPFTGEELGVIRGRDALAESYAGPEWPRTPRTMRHVISNVRIEVVAADCVRSTSTWTGYRHEGAGLSVSSPMAVGDYADEMRRESGGRWRIHRRKIVVAFLDRQLLEAAARAVGR